ncbi:MAG: sigma-70 family RNA polymerase sigma factor [Phycisphaerae bacterium]|nr:sigma-70 family RNA polymerase sigma factor [Phycisphaerae bacterium]
MLEDRLLIRQLRRGDQAALRLIYERNKDHMLTVAHNLLLDRSLAEDCLHDVFVDLAVRAAQFRLHSNLKGYLATCIANRARDVLRSKSRQNVSLSAMPEHPANPAAPPAQLIHSEQATRLRAALTELPFEQRQAIVLHLNAKLKFRQIAKQLGLSVNTVQSRYRYGLDKLRSLLKTGAEA